MSNPLLVATDPTSLIQITAPGLRLYDTSTSTTPTANPPVVKTLAQTVMFDGAYKIIEIIYTFELLSALLDSAPSGTTPTLFFIQFNFPTGSGITSTTSYVIDATIQTKGNSALSPTYLTQAYLVNGSTTQYAVGFPITNFFNVSAPGAPYTLFLTLQQKS